MAAKSRLAILLRFAFRMAQASLPAGKVRDRLAFEPTYVDATKVASFLKHRTSLLRRYRFLRVIRLTGEGSSQNLYRARRRLSFVLPVTIAIIFALLFTTFKSAKYAGLVLISVPFSMVGGILFLYLRGMH